MKLQLIFEASQRPHLETLLDRALIGFAGLAPASQPLPSADTEEIEAAWGAARLQLPWAAGLGLIGQLKRVLPRVGIIVTHAGQGVAESVQAYHSGADIFMNEQASEDELDAMARAMVRRLRQVALRMAGQAVRS